MKRRAFTLIELLVVIAIIALLLSVLLPSLRKAKSQARKIVDRTNLRSLGLGLSLYLAESDDKYFDYVTGGGGACWLRHVGKMIDDIDEVRLCPETMAKSDEVEDEYAKNPGTSIWGTSAKPWAFADSSEGSIGSYGLNGWLYGDANKWVPAGDKNKPYSRGTDIQNTSKTPVFLDANWVDSWPKNTNVLPATGYDYSIGDRAGGTQSTAIGRFVIERHGPETNVIFADSHAETIPHAGLWTLTWHKDSSPNSNPVIPEPVPAKR